LIISNALLASAILIVMAYYLISRATVTSDFLGVRLTKAVQDVTENELRINATRFANDLDGFFGSLLNHMETITSALQIEMANEQTYTPISASPLRRLPQGGWDNSNSEPGSIFVSSRDEIPESILSEINVVRQIDLIVPSIMEKNPDVLAIYFGGALGEMLYYPNIDLAANLPPDFDVTEQSWFTQANPEANPTRKTVCSNPHQNADLKPIITCSAPVFDVSDRFRGVVAMDIHLAHVTDLVSIIPVGKTGYAFVIDTKGHVIGMPQRGYDDFGIVISPGEDPLAVSVLKTAPIEVFAVLGYMTSGTTGIRRIQVGDVDKYIAFSPIKSLGYSFGLQAPANEMLGPVLAAQSRLESEKRNTLINLVVGSSVVLLVFLAAILWLGTTLTSPIVRLTQTASLIAEGDIDRVAEVESNDEIGVLASTLNLMTKNLRELINDLEHRVAERTEELQASNVNLERRVAELAIVNSMSLAMVQWLDETEIIRTVGDKVRDIFTAEVTEILMLNESTNLIYSQYSYYRGYRQFEPFALGEGLTSHIIQTRMPIIQDTSEEGVVMGAVIQTEEDETESYVGAPILSGDKVLGVVSVQSYKPYAFNENHMHLLSTLAANMGVALEKARLFNEIQRLFKAEQQRAAELAILNELGKAMGGTLDVKMLTRDVGDIVREIFEAEIADILLYDQKSNMVHLVYSYSKGYFDEEPPWELSEGGLTTQIIRSGQPLLLNSAQEMEQQGAGAYVTTPAGEPDPQSYLGVPIKVGERILGVVDVQSLRPNAFDENNLRLMQTLSSNMGVALENARLFDETQRLLQETEQRNAELAIINSVQAGLVAKMDIQGIYDLVGDKIRDIFDAQVVDIGLYSSHDHLIHFPYTIERGVRFPDEPIQVIGFRKHVMETRKPLLINQDTVGASVKYGNPSAIQGEVPKSEVFVPMIVGHEAKGVISLQNLDREHAFSETDVRLLQTLANSMSVALENARLFDETQRLLKVTEDRAAELSIINSVQKGLASNLDMQAIYDLVGDKVRDIFNTEVVYIAVRKSEDINIIDFPYYLDRGNRIGASGVSLGEGITSKVILSKQPFIANTMQEQLDHGAIYEEGEESQSYLGVPIAVGDFVAGVVSVQSYKQYAFDDADVRLLSTLSSSMGVALENARLFDETQRLLKETEQRAQELAAISMVSQALVAESELDSMIQLIGSQMREIFDADIVYVALLDPQTNLIHFPFQIGESFTTLNLGEGLTGKIIETGEPLLFNRDVNARSLEIGATPVGKEVLSYLGIPIKVGRKTIGVISVQSTTREGLFDDDSLRLLTTIASNAGSAIHTARLYSETQRLFKDAEEARAAAEQANKAKSTFLANMSHELRTPLNAIIGFTRIVRRKAEGALPEKQIENLDKVLSSSEHLLGLINTVLDIAKIEAGRMDVIPAKFNMSTLAEQCANLATPLLKPNVKLEKQVDETISAIFSDQDKIKQIVLNLLSNAAKFTHEGRILLSVEKLDEEFVSISVTDSGIGISEEALGRIFEEFQQADTSTTREYGGTGLGLAISRNLARLLSGDLTATSEPGKGSKFILTLPIQYGHKSASPAEAETAPVQKATQQPELDSAKHRVLVIDDDPDALYFLQEGLGTSEFDIISARNGHAGLQIARDQQPEAILLDILMPETDGWQILNDLKSDAATADIPVILLTIVDKKALGFKLGAADYLLKPLDPVAVLDALRRVVGEVGQARKYVLVVDDDPNVAEMLRQTLPESEFELDSAGDGRAGLRAIRTRHPDLILLDLMMPKLDGFGVIENLRADPELRNIPIIVISAKDLTSDESKKLRESVAFVMKKQGLDGSRLIHEISSALAKY
jgi:signal transduction histidine kinase/DNA-binding response OmpR family regulator